MKKAAKSLFSFYWGSGIADDVPALTYYLVLSLAPFFLGLAALAALIFDGGFKSATITGELSGFLPGDIRQSIVTLVLKIKHDPTTLLVVSVLAMMWTTSSAIGVIERTLARILGAPRYPIVWGRLRNFALGGALGVTLLLSIALATLIGGLGWPTEAKSALPIINFLGATVFCAFIFFLSVRGGVHWRSAFAGAIPTALVLQLAPLLVGLYFKALAAPANASIFFSFAVILLGCYLVAMGFLIGAGILAKVEIRLRRE